MRRKPFILAMLLTTSVASHAATDVLDSSAFMGVNWVWIYLALSLYAGMGLILAFALCKAAAASDSVEEKTYEAIRSAAQWSPRRNRRLDLNLADFEPQFLDIHILTSDLIMVRVDDVATLKIGRA
jgi:hypothetical protein